MKIFDTQSLFHITAANPCLEINMLVVIIVFSIPLQYSTIFYLYDSYFYSMKYLQIYGEKFNIY